MILLSREGKVQWFLQNVRIEVGKHW